MNDKSLETVPGPAGTYDGQKTFGVVAGRSHVEIAPKYGGTFKAGDIIRLEIPAQAYLDPNEFYISIQTSIFAGAPGAVVGDPGAAQGGTAQYTPHTLSATAANQFEPLPITGNVTYDVGVGDAIQNRTCQFVPGIQSIFSRVRLLAGSVVLEDIQEYNVLYRMLMECTTSKHWRDTDGAMWEGVYDPGNYHQRATNANFHAKRAPAALAAPANLGHVYCFKPLLGIFSAGKYLPLKYMGQLTLEFYLAENAECLWSTTNYTGNFPSADNQQTYVRAPSAVAPLWPNRDVTTAAAAAQQAVQSSAGIKPDFPNAYYHVEQVRMHVPFVHPIESFDQAMMRSIEAGDIAIFHSSWSVHTRQLPTPSARTVVNFQERALSLKGALACFRNSRAIRNIQCDFAFPANGIQEYQWKIGSEYIPAQRIDCTKGAGPALAELHKALGIFDDHSVTNMLTQDSFLPDDLPHANDHMDIRELTRGASEPSRFFMGLDLEKSPGQASGFDSAAASVDVELILNLTEHHKLMPTRLANKPFYSAPETQLWQPTKYPNGYSRAITATAPSIRTAYGSGRCPFVLATAAHDGVPHVALEYQNARPGWMVNPLVTYTVTGGTHAGNLAFTRAYDTAGEYARLYFFAHIDQVLRLTAVGRMEIVR